MVLLMPEGEPREFQPVDMATVVRIADSPTVTTSFAFSLRWRFVEMSPSGLFTIHSQGLGRIRRVYPSLQLPGGLPPLVSISPTIPYVASPVPPERVAMAAERLGKSAIQGLGMGRAGGLGCVGPIPSSESMAWPTLYYCVGVF